MTVLAADRGRKKLTLPAAAALVSLKLARARASVVALRLAGLGYFVVQHHGQLGLADRFRRRALGWAGGAG
jgi:hypothetical protein